MRERAGFSNGKLRRKEKIGRKDARGYHPVVKILFVM